MSFHAVCDVDELPAGACVITAVNEGRVTIGVYNIDGALVAVRNACPHAGAPVCRGELTGAVVCDDETRRRVWAHEGRILKCPWHGWEFMLPEGVTLTEPPIRLRTFPVEVRDGKVVVDLRPAAAPSGSGV